MALIPKALRRSSRAVALGAMLLCVARCGGSDSPTTFAAAFTPSGTSAGPNVVRLRSLSASGDTVVVQVVIGGVTTSSDLYSFAFDLALSNPAVASYVAGSAAVGNALTLSGGQTLNVQAATNGSRVVVGVTKLGGGAGNGVPAGESIVVSLAFRATGSGTTTVTFAGVVTAQNPSGGPAALDSTGALVPSVQFDTAAASITGS